MLKYFCELNANELAGQLVLLDIDGTIVSDGSETVDGRILEKIKELLSRNAAIMLVSNNKNVARVKMIAETAGVPYLDTPRKKPDRRILADIGMSKDRRTTMIGDKFMTDGLLAKRGNIDFVKIKRLTSPRDRWFVTLSYIIDDLLGPLFMRRG